MKGIIVGIDERPDKRHSSYYLLCIEGKGCSLMQLRSNFVLDAGSLVDAQIQNDVITNVEVEDTSAYPGYSGLIDAFVKIAVKKAIKDCGNEKLDAITKPMGKKLREAARVIAKKVMCAAPVFVRFHNDADGASGAYSLYKAIGSFSAKIGFSDNSKIKWKMHRSVAYSREDALEDLSALLGAVSVEKPLLVIIDFGTTEESNEGYEMIKDAADVIWLEHHPPRGSLKFAHMQHYINPWNFGGDSNYTAGYLTCELSRYIAEIDNDCEKEASLFGDHSIYAKGQGCGKDLATLLDLLTSDKSIAFASYESGLTPIDIHKIVSDKGKMNELVEYANARMEEMIRHAMNIVRKRMIGESYVYVLDFSALREGSSNKFPLPGRFSTRMSDYIDGLGESGNILILTFSRYISIRIGERLRGRIDLNEVIDKVAKLSDRIESGGGHMSAGSIKIKEDSDRNAIIGEIIGVIRDMI